MLTRPAITTVIPTRGMLPLLRLCVEHLRRGLDCLGPSEGDRIVIIDNATVPPLPDNAIPGPNLSWLRFDASRSFSACCNTGMNLAPNPFYLMLNNDVILHEEALVAMMKVLRDDPEAGICGARLVFPDGTIQHGGIRFGGSDPVPYHVHRTQPSHEIARVTCEYQAVTAACMLIKSAAQEDLNGFDEAYPFSFEDIDYCLRARQAGWKVLCAHAVDSLHFESMTPGRMTHNQAALDVFRSKWEGKWSIDG